MNNTKKKIRVTVIPEEFIGFNIGQPVRIIGDHPWAGMSGKIDRYEKYSTNPNLGNFPIIKIRDNISCFITDVKQMEKE